MARIALIRHAEPELRGRLLGWSDPPLSAAGRTQAALLRTLTVERAFSSPLLRARQTAEAIDAPTSLVLLDDLREIGFGEWDGLTWQEAEQRDPAIAKAKLADWFGVTPPAGESWAPFTERVTRAALRIERSTQTCAVVAHAGVLAVLAARWLAVPFETFQMEYGEVRWTS